MDFSSWLLSYGGIEHFMDSQVNTLNCHTVSFTRGPSSLPSSCLSLMRSRREQWRLRPVRRRRACGVSSVVRFAFCTYGMNARGCASSAGPFPVTSSLNFLELHLPILVQLIIGRSLMSLAVLLNVGCFLHPFLRPYACRVARKKITITSFLSAERRLRKVAHTTAGTDRVTFINRSELKPGERQR